MVSCSSRTKQWMGMVRFRGRINALCVQLWLQCWCWAGSAVLLLLQGPGAAALPTRAVFPSPAPMQLVQGEPSDPTALLLQLAADGRPSTTPLPVFYPCRTGSCTRTPRPTLTAAATYANSTPSGTLSLAPQSAMQPTGRRTRPPSTAPTRPAPAPGAPVPPTPALGPVTPARAPGARVGTDHPGRGAAAPVPRGAAAPGTGHGPHRDPGTP